MMSSNLSVDDSTNTTSLLDVVLEEYNLESHLRTTRMLYISYFKSSDVAKEAIKYHTKFVKRHDGMYYNPYNSQYNTDYNILLNLIHSFIHSSGNGVTGALFIINDRALIHFLEAPTKVYILIHSYINVTLSVLYYIVPSHHSLTRT